MKTTQNQIKAVIEAINKIHSISEELEIIRNTLIIEGKPIGGGVANLDDADQYLGYSEECFIAQLDELVIENYLLNPENIKIIISKIAGPGQSGLAQKNAIYKILGLN